MDVKAAFDSAARDYDRLRRQLIPCFDDFYGMAVGLLDFSPTAPLRILDIGAGTGLLAARIAPRFPAAHFRLVDLSEAMLAKARERFAATPHRFDFAVADYASAPLGGPYDAIVSAVSIHHLADPQKRSLYERVFAALAPGGLFVNAETILAADPAVHARDWRAWIDAVRATGIDACDLDAALARTHADVLAPLELQLGWMRAAGFAEVDCAFKWRHFAVFSGRRPA